MYLILRHLSSVVKMKEFSDMTFFCEVRYIFMVLNTAKPVNKGHSRERQDMVFIDKWPLFGGYFVLFYQRRVIEV